MKKFLIAGGNSTLLVWNCPSVQRERIVKQYLGEVEQIGFIDKNKLVMMGGELCINAIVALASQLSTKGILYASGLDTPINYVNRKEVTSIQFSLNVARENNTILLPGIGFICTDEDRKVTKRLLSSLAKKYNMPAFGIAIYRDEYLTPYVFVKETNSLLKETACGSGSIVTSIAMGISKIKQPTGEYIEVAIKNDKITVSAQVKEIS